MAKRFNTSGGGANTNRNGLQFERGTDLREAFVDHARYRLEGDSVIDLFSNTEVGTLYEKYKLYNKLLKPKGIDAKNIISKKLLPDDAILVNGVLYVIEKKYQGGSGSVDEKLQTCHFKLKQYNRLMQPLGYEARFYFILNDWFTDPCYKDVLEYIKEVGCDYFFTVIPLERLGL